jgi:hypothetical protein
VAFIEDSWLRSTQRGRIVDDLYNTAYTLTRHLPGGLADQVDRHAAVPDGVVERGEAGDSRSRFAFRRIICGSGGF